MTQPSLFPSEQSRREAIFWYFLEHFDIVLCLSEEYENMEALYPIEYKQFLESINQPQ